jgi:hypothetical protein
MRSLALSISRSVALGLLAACTSLCQDPKFNPPPKVPDYVIYDAFFFRVSWSEEQANKLASQGKDSSFLRSAIRRQAGLTEQETTLKAIAADYRAQGDAILSVELALVAANPGAGGTRQLRDAVSQRIRAVNDHVAQLQAALAPARFRVAGPVKCLNP